MKALENAQEAYPIPGRDQLKKTKGAKSGIDKNRKYHDNIDPTNIKDFIAAGGRIND